MHRLFDDGETRDELVVRRHHPLVRHAFGASGLDHLWEGLKNAVAVAGWFLSRVGEISTLMKVIYTPARTNMNGAPWSRPKNGATAGQSLSGMGRIFTIQKNDSKIQWYS